MKRKAILLLGMIMILSGLLIGCGGSGNRVVSEKTTEEEKNVQTEKTTEAQNSAQTEESVKSGLAMISSVNKSKDAGEEDGLAQADITVAAVTVDGEGKITSCAIDAVQVKINFSKDGKITTDLATEFASKQELGESYGMKNASGIGKEWNEQADAFAAYCVGKTVEEVKGIAVTESGAARDEELAASVTIGIGDFQAIVAKAVENAK